jgi:hypothetical protein
LLRKNPSKNTAAALAGWEFLIGDLGIIALVPTGKHLIAKVGNSEHNLSAQ